MLISFIIPYYNEPYEMLMECLDSIRGLDIRAEEREIIVVDDGSDNGIGPCMAEDIKLIKKPNGGLSSARNCGIETAKGDYIQFIDSDDKIIPSHYNLIISQLNEEVYDMIMFGFCYDINKAKSSKNTEIIDNGEKFMTTKNLRAAAWSYIFKRNVLQDLKFKEGILHEDELFTPLLLLQTGKLCIMDVDAYFYRQHKGTIMHRNDKKHITKRLDDALTVISEIEEHRKSFDNIDNGDSAQKHKALKRRRMQLTMDYIYNVAMLTKSLKELKGRIHQLHQKNLYPLEVVPYTKKYWIFALVTRVHGMLIN